MKCTGIKERRDELVRVTTKVTTPSSSIFECPCGTNFCVRIEPVDEDFKLRENLFVISVFSDDIEIETKLYERSYEVNGKEVYERKVQCKCKCGRTVGTIIKVA